VAVTSDDVAAGVGCGGVGADGAGAGESPGEGPTAADSLPSVLGASLVLGALLAEYGGTRPAPESWPSDEQAQQASASVTNPCNEERPKQFAKRIARIISRIDLGGLVVLLAIRRISFGSKRRRKSVFSNDAFESALVSVQSRAKRELETARSCPARHVTLVARPPAERLRGTPLRARLVFRP
jgi:hypothetical protein